VRSLPYGCAFVVGYLASGYVARPAASFHWTAVGICQVPYSCAISFAHAWYALARSGVAPENGSSSPFYQTFTLRFNARVASDTRSSRREPALVCMSLANARHSLTETSRSPM